MPSIIQSALLLEALVNIPGIVSLTFFPAQTVSHFLASPLPSLELNATTTLFARSLGLLILALTPQLLLAYPNGKDSVGKRRIVYTTLGMGEGALIPLLLWEAFRASDAQKVINGGGGWRRESCLLCVGSLMPLLVWRGYLFMARPHWFGESDGRNLDKKSD